MKLTLSTSLVLATTLALSMASNAESKPRSPGEIIAKAPQEHWRVPNPENLLYMELESGRVILELSPEFAPNHANNIKALTREGFYDGLNFYRVIDGFVAQGGDYANARKPKVGKQAINEEFNKQIGKTFSYTSMPDKDGFAPHTGFKDGFPISLNADKSKAWITHCAGVLAMARSNSVNSGGTEIYVTLQPQRYLDNNITVFGRVLMGMEHLQKLERSQGIEGARDVKGKNIIKSMKVAADIPEEQRVKFRMLATENASFKEYIESRRNRPSPWFVATPDYTDVCSVSVPIELIKS